MSDYDNIIDHPHFRSQKHPHMSMEKRAAQFSPFAALTGYGEAVEETGRLTSGKIILDEDARAELDRKLKLTGQSRSVVTITHFIPDLTKDGGTYLISSGRIRKIDAVSGTVIMEDGAVIMIDDIFDINGVDDDGYSSI